MFDTYTIYEYNDIVHKSIWVIRNGFNTDGKGLIAMKTTGIIRKVDELGRIVLPIELRRMLDIVERDELEIYMDQDRIVLQKFEPACIFCGFPEDLVTYNSKNVCRACIRKMHEL